MNLRDIRYLIAVADVAHFGRAAERCHVSQPTLSAQLKKLEAELGVQLFERDNKRVMITSVGERIVAQARVALQEIDKLHVIAQNYRDPFSGTYRLGIIPTLGPYLLPHILRKLNKQLPNLVLKVYENKTQTVLQELKNGYLDAVILALPVETDGLELQEIFKEPFYVALPKTHPFAKKSKVRLDDLEDETLLLLEEGHCLREQALEACRLLRPRERGEYSATSLETLRHVVAAGAGITLLPALAVKSAKQDKNIVIKPFDGAMPSRRIGMLWRQSSARQECHHKMADLITVEVDKQELLLPQQKVKVMRRDLSK